MRPDVIITYAYEMPLAIVPNQFGCPVKIIEVVHNRQPFEARRIIRWHRYLSGVIAPSQDTFDFAKAVTRRVKQAVPLPVRLIRHGVAESAPLVRSARASSEPLRIIWYGRVLQDQKRVLDLIRICAALDARRIRYRLMVLGTYRSVHAFALLEDEWRRGAGGRSMKP